MNILNETQINLIAKLSRDTSGMIKACMKIRDDQKVVPPKAQKEYEQRIKKVQELYELEYKKIIEKADLK